MTAVHPPEPHTAPAPPLPPLHTAAPLPSEPAAASTHPQPRGGLGEGDPAAAVLAPTPPAPPVPFAPDPLASPSRPSTQAAFFFRHTTKVASCIFRCGPKLNGKNCSLLRLFMKQKTHSVRCTVVSACCTVLKMGACSLSPERHDASPDVVWDDELQVLKHPHPTLTPNPYSGTCGRRRAQRQR